LFCFNEEYQSISNYPLDRIVSVEELNRQFAPSTIDWMEYFEDIIGVTKPEDGIVEKIYLRFTENRLNYVLTKPLHGTQKLDKTDSEGRTISIEVIPNKEFYQMLLSFGDDVVVVSPEQVREEMIEKIKCTYQNY